MISTLPQVNALTGPNLKTNSLDPNAFKAFAFVRSAIPPGITLAPVNAGLWDFSASSASRSERRIPHLFPRPSRERPPEYRETARCYTTVPEVPNGCRFDCSAPVRCPSSHRVGAGAGTRSEGVGR